MSTIADRLRHLAIDTEMTGNPCQRVRPSEIAALSRDAADVIEDRCYDYDGCCYGGEDDRAELLEKALKPFADACAAVQDKALPDDHEIPVKLGDLRKAVAAIAAVHHGE